MAYILGFIYADGSIYPSMRGKYLSITSTDKDIIFKIKRWLNSEHKITITKPTWKNGKDRYILRIGNKNLYSDLQKHGLYPNKSLTIRLPEISNRFFKDFLRGYFDGDGCVNLYLTKGKTQPLIIRKLSVIFTSGSKSFLEDTLCKIKLQIDLKQNKVYNSHRSFQLRFATYDSMKLFEFMYKNTNKELFLSRKYKIFQKYLKLKNGVVAK